MYLQTIPTDTDGPVVPLSPPLPIYIQVLRNQSCPEQQRADALGLQLTASPSREIKRQISPQVQMEVS